MKNQQDRGVERWHLPLGLPAASGSFLRPDEDAQEFLDFRMRQMVAIEPKALVQLQLALTIAYIGWEINRYTRVLDHLASTDLTASEPTKTMHPPTELIRSPRSRVGRSNGFDRTMVPFSEKTRVLVEDPTNVQLLEARISELEDHIDCLSAELRRFQAIAPGKAYMLGSNKLH